jgi:hypothetical protein
MTAAAQITISVQVTGNKVATYQFPNPQNPIPPQNATSPASDFAYTLLLNGTQVIAVPANAQYVLLIPQGAGNLTIASPAGATAIPISNTNPSLIALRPGTSAIYIFSDTVTTIEGCFF